MLDDYEIPLVFVTRILIPALLRYLYILVEIYRSKLVSNCTFHEICENLHFMKISANEGRV